MSDVQIIETGSDITPGTGGQTEYEAALMARTDLPEVKPEFAGDSPVEPSDKTEVAAKTPPKAELLDKAPSPLHESLALYISDKTGFPVSAEMVKIVQLTLALHGEHQASNEWKAKKAALESAREAAKAKAATEKAARSAKVITKKASTVEKALQVGIDMIKAGAQLPAEIEKAVRVAAEAAGIELPAPKEEAKPEPAKEAKPQRPSRAAKAAVGRAVSAEAKTPAKANA